MCTHRAFSAFRLACFICPLLALVEGGLAQTWTDPLTPQERQGHAIYHKIGTSNDITAQLADSAITLPASTIRCVNCHGAHGQGTDEGGLRIPPLLWSSLTSPRTSALTGKSRVPYDDRSLARAIVAGQDASGHLLHTGMPRFQMSTEQLAALIAYVKQLGGENDREPGVSATSLAIGTALPLTGLLSEIGQDVQTSLRAYVDHINRQGGLYGRTLDLKVEDSQGTPQGTAAATRRLVEAHHVFALVSSFEPTDSSTANELITREGIPTIGPLTISPRVTAPPPVSFFYLLPGFEEQAQALVDFLVPYSKELAINQPLRIGLVFSTSELDLDAIAGVRRQAAQHNLEVIVEHRIGPQQHVTNKVVTDLLLRQCNAVFYFGNTPGLHILATEMDRRGYFPILLSLLGMVDPLSGQLPHRTAERAVFATSSRLPSTINFGSIEPLVQARKVRHLGFVSLAYAGAALLVDTLKRSGRQITRNELIESLERLHGYETGTTPPLTFSPTRHVGTRETTILILSKDGTQLVPLSQQILPGKNP